MNKVIGGIYSDGGGFAVSDGNNLFFLFGYCLRIDKMNKRWQIIDTGHKNCRDIIAEGGYIGDFESSLKPLLRIFGKDI